VVLDRCRPYRLPHRATAPSRDQPLHITTIYNTLGRAGISLKKLRRVAQERNEDLHIDYMRKMAQYSPDGLVFLDEVHRDKNDRTPQRFNGRAKNSAKELSLPALNTSSSSLFSLNDPFFPPDERFLKSFLNSYAATMEKWYVSLNVSGADSVAAGARSDAE
jgi:hypothetical protein